MNTGYLVSAAGALVILVFSQHGFAAAQSCAQIQDNTQRLACYDAQNGRPAPSVAPAAAPVAASQRSPVSSVPPAPPSQPAQAAGAAPVAEVRDQSRSKASAPLGADDFVNVVSKVTRITRTADERFLATLENGQVWLQLERDGSIELAVGDKVTIRKAMMGSRMMETRSGRVRVQLRN